MSSHRQKCSVDKVYNGPLDEREHARRWIEFPLKVWWVPFIYDEGRDKNGTHDESETAPDPSMVDSNIHIIG